MVVIGGGCYGAFYAGQLTKAKARGKVDYRKVIVVDRNADCRARRELGDSPDREFVVSDWTAFFDQWLTDAPRTTHDARDDQIVPSPHMPHLMFEWVLKRAQQRWPNRDIGVRPVPGAFATPLPYDRSSEGSDKTRYVSWADWICPTHCIEPALCPAIGAPRTWEMSDSVRELAERLQARLALFVCKHQVFGVGMFAASEVIAGDLLVEDVGSSGAVAAVLIGTISSCHGALNLLSLGPH